MAELKGRHHSTFVDVAHRSSPEYREFWEKLGRGEYDAGQYRRIRKDGSDVWIQASYNPICDEMRSEEHTSELQSLMRISYAVFCLKKQTINKTKSSFTTPMTTIK